jgi:DNA-binding LacI/PurR family transcriptional regulator
MNVASVTRDLHEGSAGLKENVYLLLKAIVRSSYFGDSIPDAQRVVQMARLPGLAVQESLKRLVAEDLIEKTKTGYRRRRSEEKPKGRIAFLLNANLFSGGFGIFQDYLIGLEETLHAAGYEVIYRGDFDTLAAKMETIQEFRRSGMTGLALASYAEPRLRAMVSEYNIPAVVVGNATIHQQDLGCVCSDNIGGIVSVVQHLIENNHRHIAFYGTGLKFHDGLCERLAGYEQTMRGAGLMPTRELVFQDRQDAMFARKAVMAFTAMSPRPTAIVCTADREAFELMAELQKSGLKIPDDVSVTGFDDSVFGAISDPPLTTVGIYTREIGRSAANYLLNEIEQAQLPVRIVLPTQLVVRQSVKTLPDGENKKVLSKKTDRITLPDDEILAF